MIEMLLIETMISVVILVMLLAYILKNIFKI
jgi:hypothetical protein